MARDEQAADQTRSLSRLHTNTAVFHERRYVQEVCYANVASGARDISSTSELSNSLPDVVVMGIRSV